MDRLEELVRLHRMGTGAREVARLLKMGPNTEREYRSALAVAGLLEGPVTDLPALAELKAAVLEAMPRPESPPQQRSEIEAWTARIEELLDKGLGPKAVRARLLENDPSFPGTYPQVKRLCRAIRQAKGVDADAVSIPVETKPGQYAQVDFGYVGRLYDPATGTLRKAWCFVMVLGFSRHMCVRVVFDQKVETWLRLHIECFEELGGVPEVVRPDNLKAAVIRAAFTPEQTTELQRSYRELARHYGFKVDPAPPYAPKKKGKVETAVKYVKRAFFAGREEQDVVEIRRRLAPWVSDTAGMRVHGTTGQQPRLAFETLERPHLSDLPPARFELVVWKKAKVHQDTHIAFDGRLYSVPWTLVGKEVWVRATASTIAAYFEEERVATHSRRGPDKRSTLEEHLPEHRRPWRHRSREHWEQAADALGPEAGALVREIFDADDVLYQLRAVQAVVKLLSGYPSHRVAAACRRASFYGVTSYAGVKRILVQALDLEPLPTAITAPAGRLATPRFARSIQELFSAAGEVGDEPH